MAVDLTLLMLQVSNGCNLACGAERFGACAVLGDRTVCCWGEWNNEHVFEPRPIEGPKDVERVSVENVNVACALDASGAIWGWGASPARGSHSTRTFSWTPTRMDLPAH